MLLSCSETFFACRIAQALGVGRCGFSGIGMEHGIRGIFGVLREFYGAFSLFAEFLKAVGFHVSHFGMPLCIVNDIRNFVYYKNLFVRRYGLEDIIYRCLKTHTHKGKADIE